MRRSCSIAVLVVIALSSTSSPACLAQTSAADLTKRIAEEHRRLSNQASQLRIVRDGLKQEADGLLDQRSGVIQGRKRVAGKRSNARAQRPEQVDYSKYDRCPEGNPWSQCSHEAIKQAWLEEQLRGSQYEFQRKMEQILDDLQKNQQAVTDSLNDYFQKKQGYDGNKSKYDKGIDKIRSEIKALEKAVSDEKSGNRLGSLSSKYESNGDPASISTGAGDPGGKSYGEFQLSSTKGTAKAFVDKYYPGQFDGLTPGSDTFDAKWKELAAQQPLAFGDNQQKFIKETHYDPAIQKIKDDSGTDFNARPKAVQNAFWSTAVQNGPSGAASVVAKALSQASADANSKDISQLTDAEVLKALYNERGRKGPDGKLVHFPSSSDAVQKGLEKRFQNELNDALKMLNRREGQPSNTPLP